MVDVAVAVVDEIDGAARKRITDLIEDDVFILRNHIEQRAADKGCADTGGDHVIGGHDLGKIKLDLGREAGVAANAVASAVKLAALAGECDEGAVAQLPERNGGVFVLQKGAGANAVIGELVVRKLSIDVEGSRDRQHQILECKKAMTHVPALQRDRAEQKVDASVKQPLLEIGAVALHDVEMNAGIFLFERIGNTREVVGAVERGAGQCQPSGFELPPVVKIGVKIVLHLAQLFHIGNIEFSLLRQRERDGAAVKDLAADAILGAAHHRADCRLADEERFCRL